MKKVFFILTLVFASACNQNSPQEQQWQEKVKEPVQEMNQEKKEDPRKFDEVQEREEDRREVNTYVDPNKIIWTPANQ
jgi:hypothetical protein